MPGPLSGIRVVDLTIAAAGPLAGTILAAQGAEVIKVERLDGGDFMRNIGIEANGISALFASWNRGKQSVCIDLKQPEGVALVKKLVATADVFMHNLRPGNAEEMGLGYDDLRNLKPDLIYAYLTGWGEEGPLAGQPAYDSVIQAASGIAAVQADPADGAPQFVRNALCDKLSGLVLSQLITAALFARAQSGQGQRVHVSMLQAALAFIWPDGMQANTFLDSRSEAPRPVTPPVRKTADGWISISTNKDNEFQALCRVLGRTDLASNPLYMKSGERSRNGASLWGQINPMLENRTTADLVAEFTAQRIPHAVVNTPDTVARDTQVLATHALEIVMDPDAGRTLLVRPPGDFSVTTTSSPAPAPRLGEHTERLLASVGVTPVELAALKAAATVA